MSLILFFMLLCAVPAAAQDSCLNSPQADSCGSGQAKSSFFQLRAFPDFSGSLAANKPAATTPATDHGHCPKGRDHCKYPGECGRYIDKNKDGFCDNSAQIPAKSSLAQPAPKNPNTIEPVPLTRQNKQQTAQLFLSLFTAVAVMALISEILSAVSKSLARPLRLFWNWLLLVSFTIIAGTSVLLIYPSPLISSGSVLDWHRVSGLLCVFTGVYHTLKRARCLIKTPGRA